jgi:hypothetical protein
MTDCSTSPEPHYLPKLRALAARGVLRPGCQTVDILHDHWCALFQGHLCNCDPDVQVLPAPPDDAARN